MDKFIEALLKLVPFAAWLEEAGLSKELAAGLAVVFVAGLLWLLASLAKMGFKRWKGNRAARRLDPQFDYAAVRKATDIYIPTQFQNGSPTRQDEPGFTHQYVARNPLIPFFIKTAFNEKSDSERFYLILADSGMGKTTFMINLYLSYHSFFNRHRKHEMKIFRFSNPDTMTLVKAIKYEEAKDTILLLDALDEDPGIITEDPAVTPSEAFQQRVDEIIKATRNFAEVVMTCRTQYFPGQENDPYELNIRRPDEKGFYKLNKIYISPFTRDEVNQYLKKKYGYLPFFNRQKKKNAAQLVGNAKHLVMRPMMLSYIDDLLDDASNNFERDYDIYEVLIQKWLRREADKREYKEANRKVFIKNLYEVSQKTAVAIWQKSKNQGRLHLSREEAVAIATRHQIDLRPDKVTGQSLLTCDGPGNWKFAHKSIMEFFLAKHIAENQSGFMTYSFTGMDMAAHFCQELGLPQWIYIKGDIFQMGSPDTEIGREKIETQHPVKVSDFYMMAMPVTVRQFEQFIVATGHKTDADRHGGSRVWNGKKFEDKKGINWRCDVKGAIQEDKTHPVIHISWNDAVAFADWLGSTSKGSIRLPTEAEWEYACRAGTQTPFYTGENLTTAQANYNGNHPYNNHPKGRYLKSTTPVGTYPANAWGLHDMHGNIWEWCQDYYDEDYYQQCKEEGIVENPPGPETGTRRVVRGGSWGNYAVYCRTAHRNRVTPDSRFDDVGFRLVFVPQ